MAAFKIYRRLRELLDVTWGAPNDLDVLTYDQATDKAVWAAGGAGAPGATGATGAAGSAGATGATGTVGATGAAGATGATGIGATGATGTAGANGATGATGTAGGAGATGATGTAGANGATGATGAGGAAGATGATGIGTTGATGSGGATGATGPSGSGGGTAVSQTAHGLAVGDVIRRTTAGGGTYVKAQADTEANAEVIGIVTVVPNANNFTFLEEGPVTGLSGLTDASVYYLSEITAGLLTTTEPSVVGEVSKPLLIANSTTTGVFFNWRGKVLSTGTPGSTGATGAAGATGATGTAGAAGATGATGTAGAAGATGATGTAGAAGATGATGTAGAAGATGATGTAGANGATGATGTAGSAGATGATGTAGANGATGATGAGGTTGATGATGVKPTGQLFLSAAGMWPSTTNGAAANTKVDTGTNDVDVYVLDFADGATKLFAQATVAMPSDWDAGTVTATFYWMVNSTSTNSAVWGCAGRSYGDAETVDQAMGTEVTVTDACTATANQLLISAPTSAITLAGTPAAGEMVQYKVSRDPANGSDNLAATARLLGVMIGYTRT